MALPRSRLKLLIALGALLAILGAPASAGAAGGGDSASGRASQFGDQWDFSARSSNTNTDARGRIRITATTSDPNDVYTAEVTCMRVVGATATTPATVVVSGRIVDQPPGSFALSIQVHATDSGKFSNVPDTGNAFLSGSPSPPDGTCPAPFAFLSPIVEGSVTISNTLP